MLETSALIGLVVLAAGGLTLAAGIWAADRRDRDDLDDLDALTPGRQMQLYHARRPDLELYHVRPACGSCGGRHCDGCGAEPARSMALPHNHLARHDFSEVPPSMRWLVEQVHVTFRGTLISAELAGRYVWRPVDPVAFRLWAARKLGRPLQLGGPRRKTALP